MSTTTTPTTPLTDAELVRLDGGHLLDTRAAAEIRALRAQRDDLLAALKVVEVTLQAWADVFAEKELTSVSGMMDKRLTQVRAIIARAEGRGA